MRSTFALVLAVGDEVVDDGWFRQGGGVTKVGEIDFGELAQDAAHDLAGARLAQAWRSPGA